MWDKILVYTIKYSALALDSNTPTDKFKYTYNNEFQWADKWKAFFNFVIILGIFFKEKVHNSTI